METMAYFIIPALNVILGCLLLVDLMSAEWRKKPRLERAPLAIIAAVLILAAAVFIVDPRDWRQWILSKEMIISLMATVYVAIMLISRFRNRSPVQNRQKPDAF